MRYLTLILIIVSLLALSACGGDSNCRLSCNGQGDCVETCH